MDLATQRLMSGAAGASGDKYYGDDVFRHGWYNGTGSDQTINIGFDLTDKEALVIIKGRDTDLDWHLYDTKRGATKALHFDDTSEGTDSNGLKAFTNTGFTVGSDNDVNQSGKRFRYWVFIENPGFFQINLFTGDGQNNRFIAHDLGTMMGMSWIKCRDQSSRSFRCGITTADNGSSGQFNLDDGDQWNNDGGAITNYSTTGTTLMNFSGFDDVNANGDSYVQYVWSRGVGSDLTNAQIFGDTMDQSMVAAGSYTGNGSATDGPKIDLGWEPEFVIIRCMTRSGGHGGGAYFFDNHAKWTHEDSRTVQAHEKNAEATNANNGGNANCRRQPWGFWVNTSGVHANVSGGTYAYFAVRRTTDPRIANDVDTGAGHFQLVEQSNDTGGSGTELYRNEFDAGYRNDMALLKHQTAGGWRGHDKLNCAWPNNDYWMWTSSSNNGAGGVTYDYDDSIHHCSPIQSTTASGGNVCMFTMRRGPHFDISSYEGNSDTSTNVQHGLGKVPEFIIIKKLYGSAANKPWWFYHHKTNNGSSPEDFLCGWTGSAGGSNIKFTNTATFMNDTAPTATHFTVGDGDEINDGGGNFYYAYLWRSHPGMCKVGNYTGTGSQFDISLDFTPRMVWWKKDSGTSNSGDHYPWALSGSVWGWTKIWEPGVNNSNFTGISALEGVSNALRIKAATSTSGWQTRTNENGSRYLYVAFG